MTRNYGKASELYEQLVRAYPFDEAARVNLVLGYFYARQMDRSLMAAREAAKGFPQSPVAQANLALVALYAGDFKGAESQAAVVLQAHPAYETAYVGLGLAQLALNKPEEAASSYQRLSGISAWGTSLAAAGLADLALYQGRLADAAAILARSAKTDLKAGDGSAQARKLTALGQAELLRGRSADALRAARQAVAANQQDPVLFEAARTHLGAGDEAGAMELAARLAQRLAPEPRAYAKLIEGEIALARAEPPRAVSLFTEAQTILDTWLGRVDLGLAYLESHAYTEAHAEFEAALGRRGEAVAVFLDDLPTYHYLPPVYYYLGRAQEGLGSPAAADSYRTFLALKEKGGGDPLIADARQRLQAH
jgi:tetratricopeptide (TPR) repeat protein